jgi:hypothetical protein
MKFKKAANIKDGDSSFWKSDKYTATSNAVPIQE